jgi:hypothetical protein
MNFLYVLLIALFLFPLQVRAQVFDDVVDLGFGSFDFDTSYNATIQLATNGVLNISGSGIVSNGGETVGQIRITSPDTGLVDIKCTSSAVLSDPTASDLTISSIEIAVNAGVALGAGDACGGIGAGDPVAATIDMDALPDPYVYIGGQIVINGVITLPTDHTYSTNGAGTPVTISVVVQ